MGGSLLVCMCVLLYSRDTTSGTSEQSGDCCQGHRCGRSAPPHCLSSALLLSTFPLSTPHSHATPWLSLVSYRFTDGHSHRTILWDKTKWKALLCRSGPSERNGVEGEEGEGRRKARSKCYRLEDRGIGSVHLSQSPNGSWKATYLNNTAENGRYLSLSSTIT